MYTHMIVKAIPTEILFGVCLSYLNKEIDIDRHLVP